MQNKNNKGKEGNDYITYISENKNMSSLDSKNMFFSSCDKEDISMYKGLNTSMNDTLIDANDKEISNIPKNGNSNGSNGNSTLKFLNNLSDLKIEGKIIFL